LNILRLFNINHFAAHLKLTKSNTESRIDGELLNRSRSQNFRSRWPRKSRRLVRRHVTLHVLLRIVHLLLFPLGQISNKSETVGKRRMATGGSRLLSEIATLSRQLAPALLERSQLLAKAQSSRSPNLSVNEGKAELQELVSLVSKLSVNDLGMALPTQEDFSHAPCIYTGIYEPESALLSMSLFSLRDTESLPLHDHPGMSSAL
jgi:hypothetical protein